MSTKHKKSKRKPTESADDSALDSNSGAKKLKSDTQVVQTQSGVASSAANKNTATLGWPTEDLNTLINNLAKCLPKNDVAKYSTLAEKLDWEKVRFGGYGAQECKDKWLQVMSRLRRYRTLTDMVTDAKMWMKAPWQTYNSTKKIKHPDLPKKPLTPFFRYFMEKREKMGKSHPGSSVTDLAKMLSSKFASLSERKKQRYKDAYDREFEEYKLKLEQFKVDHPEVEFGSMNKQQSVHGSAVEGPHKPRTPQQLFVEEKLKKASENEGKKESHERIKNLWSNLSDGKRIKWIRRALQDEQRFEAEVLEYIKEHPNFEPSKLKSILTKSEKELKDRFDGKPERPPNSGYSLYSKILLREMKDVESKQKMVVIAKRWKELSDNERNGYNKEAQKAMTKYVEKFETYLNHLPESERAKVMSENKLKFPSEKRLKQSQNLAISAPIQSTNSADNSAAKESGAVMYYQMERLPSLQEKYTNKSKEELMKMIIKEWNEKLTDKKKEKYYKSAESIAPFLSSGSANVTESANKVKEKPSLTAKALAKREPKRPPKSGYALFTSEQLSKLTKFEPKKRMQEIARIWNHEMSQNEKDSYDSRAKELTVKHQKDLQAFINTLTHDERREYESLQMQNKTKGRSKNAKSKTALDPVVADANVIETVDVSTSSLNAQNNSANQSDDSEEEDEEEADEPKVKQERMDDSDGSDSDSDDDEEEANENDDQEESGSDSESEYDSAND